LEVIEDKPMSPTSVLLRPLVLAATAVSWASGQTAAAPQAPASEITTREAPVTFRSTVNLVTVPVVVRDSQWNAIGGLDREDFQLFDGGKPQIVSRFTVEKFEAAPAQPAAPPAVTPSAAPAAAVQPAVPDRFVAYLFDDVNTKFTDLSQAREAAFRYMAKSLRPSERAAVYTTSGQTALDFTGDRDLLGRTLRANRPQNPITQSATDCPPMTVYMADRIANRDDSMALGAAMADVTACTGGDLSSDEAEFRARSAATRTLALADRNVRSVLGTMEGVVDKLSRMAGQRTLVLVSSGFPMPDDKRQQEDALLERAVRANIVVNSLDARALYALATDEDASAHTSDNQVNSLPLMGPAFTGYTPTAGGSSLSIKTQEAFDSALVDRDLMAEVASATGGRFFENSNDLGGGFARLATAPEYIYLLGFAPQDIKMDGKYHALKVTLRNPKGSSIEARRGYYAPNLERDPAEKAKEEIQEAFFSTEEIHDLPATMATRFLKTGPDEATVDILARVDVRQLNFKQEDGRNRNDVTVVCGLFDDNGNYVTGVQKVLEMRLKDETLAAGLPSGITVRSSLSARSGRYVARLVVRDSEGQELTALSGAVEIP
jgi:VWFA-related protein